MMNRVLTTALISILVGASLTLSGCSLPVRKPAVSQTLSEQAEVVDLPGVRYVVRGEIPAFTRDALESFYPEKALFTRQGQGAQLPPATFLAISGSGDNGDFGAGLLCGWTTVGIRPEFKGVTGISNGALIAPFAFQGSKHDSILKEVYTKTSPKDIMKPRGYLAAVFRRRRG